MGIFSKAKKLGKKAVKKRKLLLAVATLIAPGVVAKGAEKLAKIRDKLAR